MEKIDHMKYLAHMQEIDDGLMQKVLNLRQNYDPNAYNEADVLRAIKTAKLTEKEFGAVMAVKSGMSVKEYAKRINSTEDAVRGAFRGACRKISAVLQG